MRSTTHLAFLLVLAALAAAACGGDGGVTQTPSPSAVATSDTPASPSPSEKATVTPAAETLLVEVRDGAVVGGAPTIEVSTGQTVAFRVLSDVADEVHVHGVDHTVDVQPGTEAVVEFTADIPGQFEIELEESGLRLAELVVR